MEPGSMACKVSEIPSLELLEYPDLTTCRHQIVSALSLSVFVVETPDLDQRPSKGDDSTAGDVDDDNDTAVDCDCKLQVDVERQ
jgi:hypothetical protein